MFFASKQALHSDRKSFAKKPCPFFEDADTKRIPGVKTVERAAINAIIYNRATQNILCLDWKEYQWKTFVIGGIENGEEAVAAARREIREETGYTHLKLIANLGQSRSGYYAAHKKENRISNATGLLFELLTEEKTDLQNANMLPHIFTWIPVDQVLSYVTPSTQKYYWKKATDYLEPYMASTTSSRAKEREKFTSSTPIPSWR